MDDPYLVIFIKYECFLTTAQLLLIRVSVCIQIECTFITLEKKRCCYNHFTQRSTFVGEENNKVSQFYNLELKPVALVMLFSTQMFFPFLNNNFFASYFSPSYHKAMQLSAKSKKNCSKAFTTLAVIFSRNCIDEILQHLLENVSCIITSHLCMLALSCILKDFTLLTTTKVSSSKIYHTAVNA